MATSEDELERQQREKVTVALLTLQKETGIPFAVIADVAVAWVEAEALGWLNG